MQLTRLLSFAAFSVALLLTSPLVAQDGPASVQGVVRAQDGDVALSGTTVEVVGASVGVLTDQAGWYRLQGVPTGTISLRFTRLGYTTLTRTVTLGSGEAVVVDALLGTGPIRLDPVRVLLKRTRMAGDPLGVQEAPGSVHVLVKEDVESPAFVFDNVHDFLRHIPGVNVQEEDGFGLRPNIGMRGTGADRSAKITLMEDGVLIAPAPYAAPAAYYFPVAGRMEAFEVRKGSSQVRYGPRTIGGALNLVSSTIPDRLTWFAEGAGGQRGSLRGHARAGDSGANFGWLVEAYSLETDGFKVLPSGAGTGFDVNDYMAKLRLNSDRSGESYQELELKLGYTGEASDETYLGLTDEDFGRTPLARYPASGADLMEADHSQFQLRHFWTRGNVDITTTAYRNDFSRNWYKLQSVLGTSISGVLDTPGDHASALGILKGDGSAPDALRVRANNREYFGQGVQSSLGLTVGSHDIEFGARFHQDEEDRFQWEDGFQMFEGAMRLTSSGEPGTQSNRVSSATAVATYLQDEITLGRWKITPGLRLERIEFERIDYAGDDPNRTSPTRTRVNRVNAWIPGVGFSHRGDALSVFGGVHRGFGPPGPGADEETRSESSMNYELGMRWRRSGLAAQTTGFVSAYGNILGQATLATGGDGSGQTFNGGSAQVVGVEASMDYDLLWAARGVTRMPFRFAYTYTRAEFRSGFDSDYGAWGTVEAGDRLPYLPEHQVSGSIGYDRASWSLSISMNASGAMRTEAGFGPIPEGQGTDAFVVFNASGQVRVGGRGTLFAGLQNFTNQIHSVARRPAGLRPGLPRTLVMGFRVEGMR
jgi:Fe(3+) dicitrate transport protein